MANLTKGKGVNLEFFLVKSFCNPTYFCQIIWSLFGKIDKYITNRSFLIKILSKKLNWRASFKLQWPPSKEANGLQTMWIMPKNNTLHINFTEKQGKERLKVFFFKFVMHKILFKVDVMCECSKNLDVKWVQDPALLPLLTQKYFYLPHHCSQMSYFLVMEICDQHQVYCEGTQLFHLLIHLKCH